jgi:hypothetical protein
MKAWLDVFQFVVGCRHRHLSRVFTIKHHTYKVFFDCGREFDLPDGQVPIRPDAPRCLIGPGIAAGIVRM